MSATVLCNGSPISMKKYEHPKDWNDCIGTITWSDGKKYVGKFKDGLKHGYGKYTLPDGETWDVKWENGYFITGRKNYPESNIEISKNSENTNNNIQEIFDETLNILRTIKN